MNDYELRWKSQLLQGRMLAQGGGYYEIYQDMQYGPFDPLAVNSTQTGTALENLPPSALNGIEIALQSKPRSSMEPMIFTTLGATSGPLSTAPRQYGLQLTRTF
jgi:hypothetical protein